MFIPRHTRRASGGPPALYGFRPAQLARLRDLGEERLLLTGLGRGRRQSVVVGKWFRHLIQTECQDEDDKQECDTEHTVTRGQRAKEKSEQEPHRSNFSSPSPKARPINNKIRPETTPTATHRRTAVREYT